MSIYPILLKTTIFEFGKMLKSEMFLFDLFNIYPI